VASGVWCAGNAVTGGWFDPAAVDSEERSAGARAGRGAGSMIGRMGSASTGSPGARGGVPGPGGPDRPGAVSGSGRSNSSVPRSHAAVHGIVGRIVAVCPRALASRRSSRSPLIPSAPGRWPGAGR